MRTKESVNKAFEIIEKFASNLWWVKTVNKLTTTIRLVTRSRPVILTPRKKEGGGGGNREMFDIPSNKPTMQNITRSRGS